VVINLHGGYQQYINGITFCLGGKERNLEGCSERILAKMPDLKKLRAGNKTPLHQVQLEIWSFSWGETPDLELDLDKV
jgi:hypothetical protein